MDSVQLATLVDEELTKARAGSNGRHARTLAGGHSRQLRQTLLTLVAGQSLAEHDSPGEATLQVLRGKVRVSTATDEWTGVTGDLLHLPPARHGLDALEDCAVLLTVAVTLQA